MVNSYKVASDIEVLTSNFPIPGYGQVAINAFVIKGSEPILVDTGAAVQSKEFMPALRSVIDPADLKWLWLTHTDFDHIGSLHQLLAENPKLRVITSFLSVGIMSLYDPLPMDRLYLVNPGEKITIAEIFNQLRTSNSEGIRIRNSSVIRHLVHPSNLCTHG